MPVTRADGHAANAAKKFRGRRPAEPGIPLSKQWKFDLGFAALERNKANNVLPAIAMKEVDEQLPDEIPVIVRSSSTSWSRRGESFTPVQRSRGSG